MDLVPLRQNIQKLFRLPVPRVRILRFGMGDDGGGGGNDEAEEAVKRMVDDGRMRLMKNLMVTGCRQQLKSAFPRSTKRLPIFAIFY